MDEDITPPDMDMAEIMARVSAAWNKIQDLSTDQLCPKMPPQTHSTAPRWNVLRATLAHSEPQKWKREYVEQHRDNLEAEIRRLKLLRNSYQEIKKIIENGSWQPVVSQNHTGADEELEAAYRSVRASLENKSSTRKTDSGDEPFKRFQEAQEVWKNKIRNGEVREMTDKEKADYTATLQTNVESIEQEIGALEARLSGG